MNTSVRVYGASRKRKYNKTDQVQVDLEKLKRNPLHPENRRIEALITLLKCMRSGITTRQAAAVIGFTSRTVLRYMYQLAALGFDLDWNPYTYQWSWSGNVPPLFKFLTDDN